MIHLAEVENNCPAPSPFGVIFRGIMRWNLDNVAGVVVGVWFLIGIVYLAATTRGFPLASRLFGADDST
jgi:hypothetical protein